MPSPRSSPAMRPTSPLSPGYKASAHFDSLQTLPAQRPALHSRTSGNHQRRPQGNSLKLPSLPRFHPANFPSAQATPEGTSSSSSPQPPMSPRSYQRMYSDAQKQLYFNQRELMSAAVRTSPGQVGKPSSPRLEPLGSPGPVTPLALEGDGYFLGGARNVSSSEPVSPEELMERIREETRRQRTGNSAQRSAGR